MTSDARTTPPRRTVRHLILIAVFAAGFVPVGPQSAVAQTGQLSIGVDTSVAGDPAGSVGPIWSVAPRFDGAISVYRFFSPVLSGFLDAGAAIVWDPNADTVSLGATLFPKMSLRGAAVGAILDVPVALRTLADTTGTAAAATNLTIAPSLSVTIGSISWDVAFVPSTRLPLVGDGAVEWGADVGGSILIGAVGTLDAYIGLYRLLGASLGRRSSATASYARYMASGGVLTVGTGAAQTRLDSAESWTTVSVNASYDATFASGFEFSASLPVNALVASTPDTAPTVTVSPGVVGRLPLAPAWRLEVGTGVEAVASATGLSLGSAFLDVSIVVYPDSL